MPANPYLQNSSFGRPWTPMVRGFIIANTVVFLLRMVIPGAPWMLSGIQLPDIFIRFRWWQPLTYMFMHADFWHLALNMFALWMFGTEVEIAMGSRRFLLYYLVCGFGAGCCVAAVGWLTGEQSLTIGASGAIFGILMAYGILFAERTITLLVFFVLPVQMRAKTMVLLFGVLEFVAGVGNIFGKVSHLAHLSGLLIGYLYFLIGRPQYAQRLNFWKDIRLWWLGRKVKIINPGETFQEHHVDEILDKISKTGLNSLSPRERETLAEASRRRRGGKWPESN